VQLVVESRLKALELPILLPAFAASIGIGSVTAYVLPYPLGAFVGMLGFTEADAGAIGSVEMGTIAFAALVLAPVIDRLPPRSCAIAGAAIALIGNLFSMTVSGFWQLAIARAIAGSGAGICLAFGNAAVAGSASPVETYARVMVLASGTLLVLFVSLPPAIASHGVAGLYAVMSLLTVVLLPALWLFPRHPNRSRDGAGAHSVTYTTSPTIAIALLLAVFLFVLRDNGSWAFLERQSVSLALNPEHVGWLFALSGVTALAGAPLALVVRRRFGDTAPSVAGLFAGGAVSFIAYWTRDATSFGATILMWTPIFMFNNSFLVGMGAELDTRGRLAAACGTSTLLASAVSPGLAGALLGRYGVHGIEALVMLAVPMAIACAVAAGRAATQRAVAMDLDREC
jgi:predicted MFS family arabinose efflux permease